MPPAWKQLRLFVPDDVTIISTNGQPVIVNYAPATTTGGKPPIKINYSQVSGSLFPVGNTLVQVQAKSRDGQIVAGSFIVSVNQQVPTPPPPPIGAHPSIWLDSATRTLVTNKKNINDSDYLAVKTNADNYLLENSPQFTIVSASNTNPVQITLLEDVPWSTTFKVYIAGAIGGWIGINNDNYPGWTATKVGTKVFTIPVDSSGFGSFSGQAPVIFPFDADNALDFSGYSFEGLGWSERIQSLALIYQITGNTAYSNKALTLFRYIISLGKAGMIEPVKTDSYFATRGVLLAVALGFDWLYPLLTAQEISDASAAVNNWYDQTKINALDINGPASSNYFTGHMLGLGLAGLATIGDNLRALEIAGFVRAKMDTVIAPAFLSEMAGGGMFEAYGYGTNAWERLLWYLIGLRTATAEDLLTTNTWSKTLARNLIHNLNPNLWQIMDEADYPGNYVGIINKSYPTTLQYGLVDTIEGQWTRYLLQNIANNPYGAGAGEPIFTRLLWYDSSKTATNYKLTESTVYASAGDYHIINRSDWSDTAVWSSMNGQSALAKVGHQARCGGTLRIIRGNDLIMPYVGQWKGATGVVEDGINPNVFNLAGVYANTLYHKDGGIYNFYNAGSQAYAGGQGYWGIDTVLGQEANGAENFSYQKTDLTPAYYNNTGPSGRTLTSFIRSGFLDGAIQVLFDRLTRTSVSYTDRFQWHYPRNSTPTQAGGIVTVPFGSSKHFYKPLLPASPTIVLGNDTIDPLDGEFGGSPANTTKRVTVTDSTNPLSILGLHAFYTGDSGLISMPTTTLLTPPNHYAVEIVDGADTKIYVFSADGTDQDTVTVTP